MTKIKLIATDIDGTLFDNERHYDAARLNHYLDLLHEKGIKFAVASGNNLDHLYKVFEKSPNIDIMVAENGSEIVADNQTLFEKTIPHELVLKMLKILPEALDLKALSLSGKNATYVESTDNQPLYHMNNLKVVDDLTKINDDIFKFNIQLQHTDLDKASKLINRDYGEFVHGAVSGFGSIDIMSANINKSIGLQELCKSLDISLENVMAFGDNTNDLEMIQESGLGVAMKNGKAEVKAVADLITKDDNDHDGVLNTIQDTFKF